MIEDLLYHNFLNVSGLLVLTSAILVSLPEYDYFGGIYKIAAGIMMVSENPKMMSPLIITYFDCVVSQRGDR